MRFGKSDLVVAKRVTDLPDGTSYNKYSPQQVGAGDTRIDGGYRGAESGKAGAFREISSENVLPFSVDMSPHVLYTVQDAAQILEKAPVTVRKEARTKQIGTLKGQSYLFTDRDLLALTASFEEKESRRRHPLDPPKEVSVTRVLFERVVYLSDMVMEFKKERDRFLMIFQEVFDQYRAFQEETEQRLRKLERGK